MILLPAVDIRDGKAVRLRQGHFDDETVYADDPLRPRARSWTPARASSTSSTWTAPARASRVNPNHVERIATELPGARS